MEIVTVGEVVADEVISAEGRCHRQLGGGAVYAAVGALLWGALPRINAVAGDDLDAELAELAAGGIDVREITRRSGPSLGLSLVHDLSGTRRQVQRPGPTMAECDAARQPWSAPRPDAVHVAPQTTGGQIAAVMRCRSEGIPVSLDCMVEPYVDIAPYRSGELLDGLIAFLPSRAEVEAIWGRIGPAALWGRLRDVADLSTLVVTDGAAGATVVTAGRSRHVPPVAVPVVDATGAGDAFAGGFLAGMLGAGDPIDAAVRGAVSASFVVETAGPLEALKALDSREAATRVRAVRRSLRERDRD